MIPTIYVPISDDTLWLVDLYTHLFNKYWGNKFKVVFSGGGSPTASDVITTRAALVAGE